MLKKFPYFFGLLVFSLACEKEVTLDLDQTEPFLAVEAFLTNNPGSQQILLTYTQPYFDQSLPRPALGAEVQVSNTSSGELFLFIYQEDIRAYVWEPEDPNDRFGIIGESYLLNITFEGVEYTATSIMNEVPPVDSITFEYNEKDAFVDEDYYIGEFWAQDLPGIGDTYWIKTWKNGVYLNQPNEINIAYDAGGSAGAEFDSVIFIPPIRTAINPFDDDDDGKIIPPYSFGDSAYVEIHSLTNDAWFFLSRLANETNRPGGFGELFADPLANVPTNITSDTDARVVGYFSVSAVESLGVLVNEETIIDRLPD